MPKFGLIGKKLDHSFSKEYFNNKFTTENINTCSYENYELKNEIEVKKFLEQTECSGLNVTIPYKESIIPYLNEVDEIASKINAVNTIKVYSDGIKKGFNTDHIGFKRSLSEWDLSEVKKALILGSGGASKAIVYVLEQMQIQTLTVSRKAAKNRITYNELNAETVQDHQLIINCTPLGMYPNLDAIPPIPIQAINNSHFVFDLIYNPKLSQLLQLSQKQGAKVRNGLQMLRVQAEEAWKIWNDPTI